MKNKIYYVLIIGFLGLITAPFLGMLFYNNEDTHEKRVLTGIQDVKGISGLNQFVVDNHAFRDKLSGACLSFYVSFLKESPLPSRTVFGKDGWMFLGNDYMNVYDASLGVVPIWSSDVDRATENIATIRDFCDSIGTDFYFVIAPNKATVYPEYLALTPNQSTRFKEYVIDSLKSRFNIETIDLEKLIVREKSETPLYYKYDSHWNNYGGLLATQEVVKHIADNHSIDTISEDNFHIQKGTKTKEKDREYDLSIMLNLNVSDTYYEITPKKEVDIQDTIIKEWGKTPIVTYTVNKKSDNNLNAFFIRDSFFSALHPIFMSSIHQASMFIFFDKDIMLEEIQRNGKPDFIVCIVVERNISNVLYEH